MISGWYHHRSQGPAINYKQPKSTLPELCPPGGTLVRHIQSKWSCYANQNDLSPVTIADYASQALVARLLGGFPKRPPVAEETLVIEPSGDGADRQADFLERVTHYVSPGARSHPTIGAPDDPHRPCPHTWTLDPIDVPRLPARRPIRRRLSPGSRRAGAARGTRLPQPERRFSPRPARTRITAHRCPRPGRLGHLAGRQRRF
jgi:hypothetical protein